MALVLQAAKITIEVCISDTDGEPGNHEWITLEQDASTPEMTRVAIKNLIGILDADHLAALKTPVDTQGSTGRGPDGEQEAASRPQPRR